MKDKPLPQDAEVERSVIGELMQNSIPESLSDIHEDHFFTRSHKLMFRIMEEMRLKNDQIDPITLSSKLKDLDLINEVGGFSYVSSCKFYPSEYSPQKYLSILDEKMNLRRLIEISDRIQNSAFDNVESSKIIEEIGSNVISFQKQESSGNMLKSTVEAVLRQLDQRLNGDKVTGLQTSINSWDKALGGLHPRFYTVAARGGRGKTALMEQMVDAIILLNHPVLIFEKDMSLEMFLTRIACRRAGIPFYKLDLGFCAKYDLDQIKTHVEILGKSPIHLYCPSGLTAQKMCSIIKIEQKIHGIKAVFLDHVLNLDVGSDYRTGLTLASTKIRESVQETKIPHVILAQLNRGAHNTERPTPAHIKEFDALYADCDVMVMLWSEKEPIDVPKSEIFPMKFLVNKNRFGTEFEDDIGFDRQMMTFKPMKKI